MPSGTPRPCVAGRGYHRRNASHDVPRPCPAPATDSAVVARGPAHPCHRQCRGQQLQCIAPSDRSRRRLPSASGAGRFTTSAFRRTHGRIGRRFQRAAVPAARRRSARGLAVRGMPGWPSRAPMVNSPPASFHDSGMRLTRHARSRSCGHVLVQRERAVGAGVDLEPAAHPASRRRTAAPRAARSTRRTNSGMRASGAAAVMAWPPSWRMPVSKSIQCAGRQVHLATGGLERGHRGNQERRPNSGRHVLDLGIMGNPSPARRMVPSRWYVSPASA